MSDESKNSGGLMPTGELILYASEDGTARLQVRLSEGTVWLTQRLMGELYGKDVRTINEHLGNIYEDEELDPAATIRKFRIVQTEGKRSVSRLIDHYALPAIIAVGYRVRSRQGTRFRQWATARLEEYLVKGFALDDDRLKAGTGHGEDYFDELLERIRDIRASERRFYQKITDIYAQCSVDYDPRSETTQAFYATVQNKLHWAIHGQTAAEMVHDRADASSPCLTRRSSWSATNSSGAPSRRPRRHRISIMRSRQRDDSKPNARSAATRTRGTPACSLTSVRGRNSHARRRSLALAR